MYEEYQFSVLERHIPVVPVAPVTTDFMQHPQAKPKESSVQSAKVKAILSKLHYVKLVGHSCSVP